MLLSFETGYNVVRIDSIKDWTDDASEPVYDTWFLNTLYDYEYHVPYLGAAEQRGQEDDEYKRAGFYLFKYSVLNRQMNRRSRSEMP